MSSIEIHQLRYFVEVVKSGNFTQAAARCNVTQPTLSHQIKKLEDTLGEPIIQRLRKGAKTTAFGRALYARAITILSEVEAAKEDASSYFDQLKGELNVGVIPTIAPYLMARILAEARERCPQVIFDISEDTTENLLSAMKHGEIDIALISLPVDGDEWETIELMEDEILLALPPAHHLRKQKKLLPEHIAGEPVVLMREAHCFRGQSVELCSRHGITPKVTFQSSQIDTLISMVEANFGISFVPALARKALQSRKIELRSFEPTPAYRPIGLVHPRLTAKTRATKQFIAICQDLLKTPPAK